MLQLLAIVWLLLVCLGVVGGCIVGLYRMARSAPREFFITLMMVGGILLTVAAAIIVTT